MADDLKNKPKKNNETKKTGKDAKIISSDKPEVVTSSPNKTKELKKDTSTSDKKELQKVSQPNPENKKVI